MVLRSKLLDARAFGKRHVILVGRDYLVRIFLRGFLNHREERGGHFLAVDDERAAENFVAAVLGVDLREAKHLGVGEFPPELLLHAVEILYLGGREGETFLLVIGFEVFDVDDGRGRVVHGEDVLIQPVVEALQHGVAAVVAGVLGHGEELLYTRNAAEVHVLGDLHGIGAPRRYHFASRAGEASCECFKFKQFGVAVKPAQFLAFFFRKHVVHLRGNDAAGGGAEKQNLHKGRQKGCCRYYMCAKLRFSYEIVKFHSVATPICKHGQAICPPIFFF